MITRKLIFTAFFAATVLGSTGCCGRVRNAFYRVRHCVGCAQGFEGPAPVGFAPGGFEGHAYSSPVVAGGAPTAGCASCGGGGGAYAAAPTPPAAYPSYSQPMYSQPGYTGGHAVMPNSQMFPGVEVPKTMPAAPGAK